MKAAFPYEWLVLAGGVQLPKSSQTSDGWSQGTLGLALAAANLDLQLGFIWESSSTAQLAAISDCFIAQAGWPWQTQVGTGLDPYHLGNLKASTLGGQLQTML